MVLERPCRENGAERIETAWVQVGLVSFEMCSKVMYWSKWTVSSTQMIDYRHQANHIKNNNMINWPLGEVFCSYLVISLATFTPFCQNRSHIFSGSDFFLSPVCQAHHCGAFNHINNMHPSITINFTFSHSYLLVCLLLVFHHTSYTNIYYINTTHMTRIII